LKILKFHLSFYINFGCLSHKTGKNNNGRQFSDGHLFSHAALCTDIAIFDYQIAIMELIYLFIVISELSATFTGMEK